jgi:hypothetical protein
MRRSRGWFGVCAVVVALAWPGAAAARAAPAGGEATFSLVSSAAVQAGEPTTVEFSYTAPARPITPVLLLPGSETVTVDLPSGWTATAPATVTCAGSGCSVTSDSGTQIVVLLDLDQAQAFTLDYPATPPGSGTTSSFGATEELGGNPATTVALPALTVTVTCPDGTGTMAVDPGTVTAGQSTDLRFTYTAGSCGVGAGGQVAVMVPGVLPQPAPGSVTWSGSSPPVVSGSMITVPVGSVGPGASVVFYYDMAGAAASAASSASYTFDAFEQSGATGSLQPLAVSPGVTVTAGAASASASVSASASSSASASASSSPSASATGGLTTGGGLPEGLVLGLVAAGLIVAAGAASLLVSRLLHRGGHGTGGGHVRAVPHSGPPPSVAVRDTGTRPTVTVHLQPHAGATVTTIEEKRP